MKKDNQPGYRILSNFLYSMGIGDLWLSPGLGDKNYITGIITDRFQNIFRHRYEAYLNSPENEKKCEILINAIMYGIIL